MKKLLAQIVFKTIPRTGYCKPLILSRGEIRAPQREGLPGGGAGKPALLTYYVVLSLLPRKPSGSPSGSPSGFRPETPPTLYYYVVVLFLFSSPARAPLLYLTYLTLPRWCSEFRGLSRRSPRTRCPHWTCQDWSPRYDLASHEQLCS